MSAALAYPVQMQPVLRDYQEAAVAAVFDWIYTKPGWPLCCMATGSGKSIVMAKMAHDILAMAAERHVECNILSICMQSELIQQNAKALALFNGRENIGIYNAKLGHKDLRKRITVASIQSLVHRAYDKAFSVILIDEVHQLADGQGQYRKFIAAQLLQNPELLGIGFTATPYKLSSGRLDQGKDALFAGVAYETDILDLITRGYLAKPTTPKIAQSIDLSNVHLRGGEYIARELADAVDVEAITESAVNEMCERGKDRNHWVVFACTVEHALHIEAKLLARGIQAAAIYGELPDDERRYRLDAFDRGSLRCAISVNLLSTGWDCPKVDLISLLRPTKSAGLYVQFLGRGMRVAPGKTDCLILDHCGLVELFGPIDAIRVRDKRESGETGEAVVKVCPGCESYQPSGVRVCRDCGFQFPDPPIVLNATASTAAVLSCDIEPEWHDVTRVFYQRNTGKAGKKDTLRVIHECGFRNSYSVFVCIEHDGFARTQAVKFWLKRSPENCPATIEEALTLVDDLRVPLRIATRPQKDNPKYSEIVEYVFADTPTPSIGNQQCWSCALFDDVLEHCAKWDAQVPKPAQAEGCGAWVDHFSDANEHSPLPF